MSTNKVCSPEEGHLLRLWKAKALEFTLGELKLWVALVDFILIFHFLSVRLDLNQLATVPCSFNTTKREKKIYII
jgi:hypothetical protein